MERRQGRHPMVVHLAYSEDWNKRGEQCEGPCDGGRTVEEIAQAPASMRNLHPRIAVRPSEFEPFRFDWTVVTGCMVCVFDETELVGAGRAMFYELLGELGRYAGPVHVFRLEDCDRLHGEVVTWKWDLFSVAHVSAAEWKRTRGDWPTWWPAETEKLNGPRRERWYRLTAGVTRQPQAA